MPDKPSLIMITQRLFYDDPFFGYNVKLIESLSRKTEHLYVLPLYGESMDHLDNVTVKPFGKSSDESRVTKLFRLYRHFLTITIGSSIEGLFIHQNQLYAPALAWSRLYFWKPFVLFKAHGQLPWNIRLALPFISKVLTSAEEGFDYPTSKKRIIGQSIDTDLFDRKSLPDTETFGIISIGRISPIKGYEVLIDAFSKAKASLETPLELTIVGEPATDNDENYLEDLKSQVTNLGLQDQVQFTGGVQYESIPELLGKNDLFVNSSVGESALDKVVLEAMSVGRPIVTTNPNFKPLLEEQFPKTLCRRDDSDALADSITYWVNQPGGKRKQTGEKLRALVEEKHSMDHFTDSIVEEFE
ncbi:MAG: glycosyltransferase family 4 protein [bacterium]